ncbi:hypothetical protein DLAC_02348 [Tieghemostelium lacteum]|uniref:EGF-like domain-containing protein n=1 Tax=Tieghemostelium lacteum TaxID=361077 RepID=A0A152A4Q9_TIELA|nr:hypothetical protein DLAC_02348 [Tieghemostelium lacteum]|eukprot:KYR01230.1 hypothetical protein DLAC_02348 [Tieghemostelium lacteum]
MYYKYNSFIIALLFIIGCVKSQEVCSVSPCNNNNNGTECYSNILSCINYFIKNNNYNMAIEVTSGNYESNFDCLNDYQIEIEQPFSLTINLVSSSDSILFSCGTVLSIVTDNPTGQYNSVEIQELLIENNNSINSPAIVLVDKNYENSKNLLSIKSTLFSNYYSNNQNNGGAISTINYNVQVSFSTFVNNSAVNGLGGSIAALGNQSSVAITYSYFLNGQASMGGAIAAQSVFVDNTAFGENTATKAGGAILAADFSIYSSIFSSNQAPLGSALASVSSPQLTLEMNNMTQLQVNSSYFGDHVSTKQGTIYIGEIPITILNSQFINNQATVGSALYLNPQIFKNPAYSIVIDQVTNFTTNNGINIQFQDLPISVTGGVFSYNQTSPFPSSFMSLPTVHTLTSSDCNGAPSMLNINQKLSLWSCVGVKGNCQNGSAVVQNGRVQLCNCFVGWTGKSCNTRFPTKPKSNK